MQIERLDRQHDHELTAFLDSLSTSACGPSVLGYHYPEYRQMLSDVLGPDTSDHSLAVRDPRTGSIQAYLPGMIQHSGGNSCYNSLPFFGPNCGVLAASGDAEEYSALSTCLVSAAIELARQENALTAVFYSSFNPEETTFRDLALECIPGVLRVPKRTHYLRFNDRNGLKFPSDIRYDLRKATSAGVTVSEECSSAELEQLFTIYHSNCLEYGIPVKPKRCVEILYEQSKTNGHVKFYTAKLQGALIAGLIVLWGPQTVSYYLPCIDSQFRSLQPGSLAIDYACRHAASAGLQFWNWESSPDDAPGVSHFKRKWGSHTSEYGIFVVPLRDANRLEKLEPKSLSKNFPFYFVYPYSLLKDERR